MVMLQVDLRELGRGPVETRGELPADSPAFHGLDIQLEGPVQVEGRLQDTGNGEYFWRGRISGTAQAPCRRCLAEVHYPFDVEASALYSSDPDAADNPEVQPLPATATQIDLTEAVREEVALAVPPFLLCREECAGLCPTCGADLNAGPCGCTPPAEPV